MAELLDEMTITLRKPVTVGGETVFELALREPTVAELEQFTLQAAKAGEIKAISSLIASVSGVSIAAIQKIGVRDFKIAEKYLSDFFGDSPKTGETA